MTVIPCFACILFSLSALEPRTVTRWDIHRFARKAYDLGVRFIGGCCGFEAYHIRAIAEEVNRFSASVCNTYLQVFKKKLCEETFFVLHFSLITSNTYHRYVLQWTVFLEDKTSRVFAAFLFHPSSGMHIKILSPPPPSKKKNPVVHSRTLLLQLGDFVLSDWLLPKHTIMAGDKSSA